MEVFFCSPSCGYSSSCSFASGTEIECVRHCVCGRRRSCFQLGCQVMTMPICVLGARLCPKGVEASLYSTIMSVSNLGGLVSSYTGAALTEAFTITNTNFNNLWKLSLLCTGLSVLPVAFVHYLPNISATDTQRRGAHCRSRNVRSAHWAARCVSQTHLEIQELQNE